AVVALDRVDHEERGALGIVAGARRRQRHQHGGERHRGGEGPHHCNRFPAADSAFNPRGRRGVPARPTLPLGPLRRRKRRMPTLILLTLSNIVMTTAWYWHLKGGPEVANARPLGWAILISWLLAGVEYTLAVPANRVGYASGWTPGTANIAQEGTTPHR